MDRQQDSSRNGTSGTGTNDSGQLTDQVKQQASKLADTAQQQAEQQFRTQKHNASQGLGSVSDALHQAADQLRKQNQDTVAGFVDEAASQVQGLQGYLQQENLHRVIDQVEGFARNQPYLFVGGAFALGALAARFLKASRPESANWGRGHQHPSAFGPQNYGPLNYPGVHYAGREPYPTNFGVTGSAAGYGANYGRGNAYGGGTTTGTGFGTGFEHGVTTTGSGVEHQSAGEAMGQYPNVVSPEGGASTRQPGENEESGNATK